MSVSKLCRLTGEFAVNSIISRRRGASPRSGGLSDVWPHPIVSVDPPTVGASRLGDVDGKWLPIGQFARLCRLSVKQLRHYDELGLLRPGRVDPHTGYRYYRTDQARDAMTIGMLRSLDVPLAAIGEVLAGANITEVLGEVRDRLEAELLRRRNTLATLHRVLTGGMPQVEVRLTAEPARDVVIVRDVTPPERIGEITSRCVARLVEAITAAGQQPRGQLIGLFPLDLSEEAGIGVAADAGGAVPGLAREVLPGGVFAAATHVGPYDQISLTAHGLLAWCAERGHTPNGPLREVYVSNPHETAPEHLVTHLMIGLEEPQ